MPLKDPKYEYVRVRTRKDKEKDRDGDTRSLAGSSVTTIRDRRHRNSFTSQSSSCAEGPAPTSTSTCQDVPLEQLPALPETEESESASNTSSPLVRSTSNIPNQKSGNAPAVDTPATLQPYLEDSGEDSFSAISRLPQAAKSLEWIGPQVESTYQSDAADTITPKPRPEKDPMASFGKESSQAKANEKPLGGDISENTSHPEQQRTFKSSFPHASEMVYSWTARNAGNEQFLHPTQMANPFLPVEGNLLPFHRSQSTDAEEASTQQTASSRRAPPLSPRPPKPDLRPPSSIDARSSSSADRYPLARMEGVPHRHQSPMPIDGGHAVGFRLPTAPALSPPSIQHGSPSVFAPPPFAPGYDHPSHLLHRIGNALPDISALMNLYQDTCGLLIARDRHINQLEDDKAMQAGRLNGQIDRLSNRIQSLMNDQAAQMSKLRNKVCHWEEEYKKLQDTSHKERQLKEDAIAVHTALEVRHKEMIQKHQENVNRLSREFTQEKDSLIKQHAYEKDQLLEEIQRRVQATHDSLTSRIANLERMHETERQSEDRQWSNRMHDVEKDRDRLRSEMEATIALKRKELEDERSHLTSLKESWDKERETVMRKWNEERSSYKGESEKVRRTLSAQHQQEKEGLRKLMDNMMVQQKEELEQKIKERDDLHRSLNHAHEHYKTEIEAATEVFQKEKEDYRKATEDLSSDQISGLQDQARSLQKEKEQSLKPRGESRSRRIEESRGSTAQALKEKEPQGVFRRQSQTQRNPEQQEAWNVARTAQRETAVNLPSRGNSRARQSTEIQDSEPATHSESEANLLKRDVEKPRALKLKGQEQAPSRSTTPGPKEDRNKSHRASLILSNSTSSKPRGS